MSRTQIATCPACSNEIGAYADIDELQNLMEEHLDVCIPSRRFVRARANTEETPDA